MNPFLPFLFVSLMPNLKSFFLKTLILSALLGAVVLFAILAINLYINSQSKSLIFSDIEKVPKVQAALILGAKVYNQETMSPMLEDRADAAMELYKSKKVEKILISGDHGRNGYDEVNAARKYLLEKGIEGKDIFLDHAGFDTYDSLYRAREIFKVPSLIVATQNFHLPRAVYIGKNLSLETYGFSADKHLYAGTKYNEWREVFSKVKAFFDVGIRAKPKFLGEEIPISGDGRISWDEGDLTEKEKMDNGHSNNYKDYKGEVNAEEEVREMTEKTVETRDVLLEVPFTSQAPFANWDDPRKQDGCEEAAAIMAMAWVRGEKISAEIMEEKVNAIAAYEKEKYGNFRDTSAFDSVEIIFKGYFGYDKAEARQNINKEDIKSELFKGSLVIVPVNGQKLGNPFYTPPGPLTHNLVIIGYDSGKKEFITNDPGTKRGEGYRYKEDVLEKALYDYPTGFHEAAKDASTAMIVVKK